MRKLIKWSLRLFAGGLFFLLAAFMVSMNSARMDYAAANGATSAGIYGATQCAMIIPIALLVILFAWFVSWISTKV